MKSCIFFALTIIPFLGNTQNIKNPEKEEKKVQYNFGVGLNYDFNASASPSNTSHNTNSYITQQSYDSKGLSVILQNQLEISNFLIELDAGYALKSERVQNNITYLYQNATHSFSFNTLQSSAFGNLMVGYKFHLNGGQSIELAAGMNSSYSFEQATRNNQEVDVYVATSDQQTTSPENKDYDYDINFDDKFDLLSLVGKISYNLPVKDNTLAINMLFNSGGNNSYTYDYKLRENNNETHNATFLSQNNFTISLGLSYLI